MCTITSCVAEDMIKFLRIRVFFETNSCNPLVQYEGEDINISQNPLQLVHIHYTMDKVCLLPKHYFVHKYVGVLQ